MSIQDLIFSDAFSAYRKKEIERAVEVIGNMFTASCDPRYIKGAIDLFHKILLLPQNIAKTDEAKNLAAENTKRDLKEFEIRFLRRFVE